MDTSLIPYKVVISIFGLYVLPVIGVAVAWSGRSSSRFALVRGGAIGGTLGGFVYALFERFALPESGWNSVGHGIGTIVWGTIIGLLATGVRTLTRRARAG